MNFSTEFLWNILSVKKPHFSCCKHMELAGVSLTTRNFIDKGHMPCLDKDGILCKSIARVIGYSEGLTNAKLVIFGHADDDIASSEAYSLSRRRAQAVQALIKQDSMSWKLVSMSATITELSLTLSGVAAAMGWECDTNTFGHLIDGEPSQALLNFQKSCIARYRIPIVANGVPSHSCWHGVFCVLVDLINVFLREGMWHPGYNFGSWTPPLMGYPEGCGVYACGASFTKGKGGTNFASRRIDLVFVPESLKLRTGGLIPAVADTDMVPVYGPNVRIRQLTSSASDGR